MISAHRTGVMALLTVGLGLLLPQRMTENVPSLGGTTGPISLGAGATRVALQGRGPGAIESALASLGERRVSLLLHGVRAVKPPGVLYQVYLDLPEGAAPDPEGPYFAGYLNFFNAVRPPETDPNAPGDGIFTSFDVTDVLTRLRALKRISDPTTVTVVPAGTPAADAQAAIASIRLMVHKPK